MGAARLTESLDGRMPPSRSSLESGQRMEAPTLRAVLGGESSVTTLATLTEAPAPGDQRSTGLGPAASMDLTRRGGGQ